ncbi:MAG: DNA-binding MarR family transcriptional regulator [Maribacter sp.]
MLFYICYKQHLILQINNKKLIENKDYMTMVVEILRTGNWIDNRISQILQKAGITHVQFNILRILEGAHPTPLTVGTIKSKILFSNSDITRLLDRLKNKDLIDRKICAGNRRKMDVTITNEGLGLTKIILPQIENDLDGFFCDKLNSDERDALISSLKKIMTQKS